MKKALKLLLSVFILAGCASMYEYEATEGYRESYNIVAKKFGQLYISSGLSSSIIEEMPNGFYMQENFVSEGYFSKSWANISVYRYKSRDQCFSEERDIKSLLYEMISDEILPLSDVKVRLYFVPEKQFHVTSKSKSNREFNFYFPVNLCEREAALIALDHSAARLVHEFYHVQIALLERRLRPRFNKQKEEENAYLLGFCNRVTSPSPSDLNRNYFDIDYEVERGWMTDFSRNRMQSNSNLGRLEAMQRIHNVFSESESIYEFCVSTIKDINRVTFGIE